MSVLVANNAAQLQSALNSAKAGDTIQLAGGSWGDVSITGKVFASDVTLTSADPNNPATFNTLKLFSCAHLSIQNVKVAMSPTASTNSWSPVVEFSECSSITFANSAVSSGPAVNGVAQTATALDATGNVQGLPTGDGIYSYYSTGVTVQGVNVSNVDKGFVLLNSSQLNLSGNTVSNIRTSAIDGADLNNVSITGNDLSNSFPWRWGQTPIGDHGDFIHIWTDSKMMSPSTNINISNNYIHQGSGVALLGINLEDNSGHGFTNATLKNNIIINGNFQGMRLENTSNSTVTGNTMLQPGGPYNNAPSVLFRYGGGNNVVTGNILGGINEVDGVVDEAGAAPSTLSGNTIVQSQSASTAGYYNAAFVAQLQGSMAAVAQALNANGLLAGGSGAHTGSPSSSPNSAPISAPNSAPISSPTNSGAMAGSGQPSSTYSGSAAAVAANLDALSANSSVKSIVITDSAPLSVSAAQVASDGAALAKLVNANGSRYSLHVIDTAANVGASLASLVANGHVSSVSLTDHAAVTLPLNRLAADTALLSKITGDHLITITGYTGQPYSSVTIDVNAQGVWASKTLHNNDGSDTVYGNVRGLTFASSTHAQTIMVTTPQQTFMIDQGFGPETVVGYQPGQDVLSFSHVLFAQAASVLAGASGDGHGGTLITAPGGNSIDLVGVTPAQLRQHPSDVHIF